jgi:hypothetical protein
VHTYMGPVKFAGILSALEQFGLVAASDTASQFKLAGHLMETCSTARRQVAR